MLCLVQAQSIPLSCLSINVKLRNVFLFTEGYTCGKCGKIFTSLSYLARHIKRVCPDMSCRKWKCTMCDKAFRHPFGLQQHIYTHTGERPHKCSQCPKAFYSSNDLRRHSRIHSGNLIVHHFNTD